MNKLFSYTFNDILINKLQIIINNKYSWLTVFAISYQINKIYLNLLDIPRANFKYLYITIHTTVTIKEVKTDLLSKQTNKGCTTTIRLSNTQATDIVTPIEIVFENKTRTSILINSNIVTFKKQHRCILSYFPIGYDLEYDPILQKKDLLHSIVPVEKPFANLDLFRMHLIQYPVVLDQSDYTVILFDINQLGYNKKFYEFLHHFISILYNSKDNLYFLQYSITILKYFLTNYPRIAQTFYINYIFNTTDILNSNYPSSKGKVTLDDSFKRIFLSCNYFIETSKLNSIYKSDTVYTYSTDNNDVNDLSLLLQRFKLLCREIDLTINKYNISSINKIIETSIYSIDNYYKATTSKDFTEFIEYITSVDNKSCSNYIIEQFIKGTLSLNIFIKTFVYMECIQSNKPLYVSISAHLKLNDISLLLIDKEINTIYVLDKLVNVEYYELLMFTKCSISTIKVVDSKGITILYPTTSSTTSKSVNKTPLLLTTKRSYIILLYDTNDLLIYKLLVYL